MAIVNLSLLATVYTRLFCQMQVVKRVASYRSAVYLPLPNYQVPAFRVLLRKSMTIRFQEGPRNIRG